MWSYSQLETVAFKPHPSAQSWVWTNLFVSDVCYKHGTWRTWYFQGSAIKSLKTIILGDYCITCCALSDCKRLFELLCLFIISHPQSFWLTTVVHWIFLLFFDNSVNPFIGLKDFLLPFLLFILIIVSIASLSLSFQYLFTDDFFFTIKFKSKSARKHQGIHFSDLLLNFSFLLG